MFLKYGKSKLRKGVTMIKDGIVKDFPGHTPGSITLLAPALKFIYAGAPSAKHILFTSVYREHQCLGQAEIDSENSDEHATA